MNKKVIIACAVAFILLIICVVIGLYVRKKKQNQVYLESDYPITYEVQKDNTIIVKLDGKKTKDLSWTCEIEDATFIDVTQQGKESGGKAKYLITPKASGLTNVEFKRSTEVAGYPYDAVEIDIPIYVAESAGGLQINFLENPRVTIGPTVVASETSYPFLIKYNNSEGYSSTELLFVNGTSDWVISDPNNIISTNTVFGEGNIAHVYVEKYIEGLNTPVQAAYENTTEEGASKTNESESSGLEEDSANSQEFDSAVYETPAATPGQPVYDPTAGTILETTITVSSQSMGVTKYLDVVVDVTNRVTIEEGKAPK